MKILFCGLGSIGQRHLRNIRRLYGDKHDIIAYRVERSQRTFSDNMTIRENVSLEDEYNIRSFDKLCKALDQKPDLVFVTNVTSKHMDIAIDAIKAGCDVFIEKPISNSLDRLSELESLINDKKSVVYVGYQYRFHPCIMDVQRIIETGRVGRIISVDSEYSERITTMHTYEDYSKTYMARCDLGGGPVLNLQIHVLDYLQWVIGRPVSVYSVAGRLAGLNVNVEDVESSLFCLQNGIDSVIPVYCHTDFLQYPPVHKLKMVGSKGRIEVDFNKAKTVLYCGNDMETIGHPDFERNNMFLDELKDFMSCVENRIKPEPNIGEGIISLRMAIASKISAKESRVVNMEEI